MLREFLQLQARKSKTVNVRLLRSETRNCKLNARVNNFAQQRDYRMRHNGMMATDYIGEGMRLLVKDQWSAPAPGITGKRARTKEFTARLVDEKGNDSGHRVPMLAKCHGAVII